MRRVALTLLALVAATPAWGDFMSGWDAYERGDLATAIAEWTRAAKAGDAKSAYNLAQSHARGAGVERDESKALAWYERAAEGGLASAEYNAGIYHLEGRGTRPDADKATVYFEKAAAQGHAGAAFALARRWSESDPPRDDLTVAWLRRAVEGGHGEAGCMLGQYVLAGRGTRQDFAEGLRLLEDGAVAGETFCQGALGYLHQAGAAGVPRDLAKAARWYRAAADRGSPKAMAALGDVLLRSASGPDGLREAAEWLRQAAEAGDATGAYLFAVMRERGEGVGRDIADARRWYRRAAEAGDRRAAEALDRLAGK